MKILLIFLLMVGLVGSAWCITYEYDAPRGVVSFDHTKHTTVYDGCTTCHTAPTEGVKVDKSYAHTTCKGCHKTVINEYPNAPVSCTGCHKK